MRCLLKAVAALTVGGVLLGCAPATRVILLPQGGGKTGAVEVKTDVTAQLLSQAYQTAEVSSKGQLVLGIIDPLVLMDRYPSVLTQLPVAAEQFLLYFETGGAQLTAESQAQLPEILARARARKGGEIVVIGHTDRVGALAANDALSRQRASMIRDLLVAQGFRPELIDAVGRGERSPVVPTDDEVAEPKNRRAEIVVR